MKYVLYCKKRNVMSYIFGKNEILCQTIVVLFISKLLGYETRNIVAVILV